MALSYTDFLSHSLYNILDVQNNQSTLRYFKAFSRKYLAAQSVQERQSAIAAYLILSSEFKKHYDVLLEQHKSGIALNQKYVKVVENRVQMAKRLLDERKHTSLKQRLNHFPWTSLLLDVLNIVFEAGLRTATVGLMLLFAAFGLLVYAMVLPSWTPAIIGFTALFPSYLIFERGVWEDRKERFDVWLTEQELTHKATSKGSKKRWFSFKS